MALQKTRTLATGVTISYWKWGTAVAIWGNKKEIPYGHLLGYVDKAAADAGMEPVGEATVQVQLGLTFADHADLSWDELVAVAYVIAKEPRPDSEGQETNWFADAQNC